MPGPWKIFDRLLAYGERITRMDFKKFMSHWVWLSSGQIVGTFTALLLALAYAHLLPKDVYGTYKYVLSVLGILAVFTLPGMTDAASRAIAQGKEGAFWPTFRARLRFGSIGALLSIALGAYYYLSGNSLLAGIFCAAAPFLVFSESFTHSQSLLLGRQHFREYSIYSAIVQIIAALGIFCVVVFSNDVFVIVTTYLAIFTLLRGIIFFETVRRFPPEIKADPGALRYGAHMGIVNVMNTTSSQLDSILLFHFLGPVALAVYAFAQAAADQARKAFKAVTTVMAFPKFALLETIYLKRELPHKIAVAHLATVPLAVVLVVIIPFFYHLLFPAYVASIPYAQVMAALLCFTPMRMISTAISAKGSIRDIYTMNIASSAFQILALAVLVPLYGIWGAVIASPLASFLTNLVSIRIFRRMA